MWKSLPKKSLVLSKAVLNNNASQIQNLYSSFGSHKLMVSRTITAISSMHVSQLNKKSVQNMVTPRNLAFQNYLIRSQSSQAAQNSTSDLKTPLNSSKKTTNNSKSNQTPPNSRFKLLAIFASGIVAYFGISFYLDHKSTAKTSNTINYSSKNLPGRIIPSKSVKFKFQTFRNQFNSHIKMLF